MLYAIPDILLKEALNTNKTGHHAIHVCSQRNKEIEITGQSDQ